jgi:hypothetical protein
MGRGGRDEEYAVLRLRAEISELSESIRMCAPDDDKGMARLLRQKCSLLGQLADELGREKLGLEEEVERLEIDRRRLRMELREALGIRKKAEVASVVSESTVFRPRRRRGAPRGHRGGTRPVPATWDSEHTAPGPARCECGSEEICGTGEYDMKYVEDIVPARKTVKLLRYPRGRCARCGRLVRSPDAVNGPPVSTGENLASHLSMLRQSGISYRKLGTLCTETLGIPMTAAGAMGVVNRVSDRLGPVYETIASALPEQEILHGDETGWKVRGDLHYLWVFCNRELAYYHPDKSRGSAVIRNLVGKKFPGTMVCDFYAAYNFLPRTQRCLVHLLRDVKKECEAYPSCISLERFGKRISGFVDAGKDARLMTDEQARDERTRMLRRELARIGKMRMPVIGRGQALAKRILKYQDDIFRFIEDPGLDYHNNRAERQLRPLVVSRKMSFGSDTIEGARRTCVLHSVTETCRLQKIKPLDFIRNFVENNPQNIFGNLPKSLELRI